MSKTQREIAKEMYDEMMKDEFGVDNDIQSNPIKVCTIDEAYEEVMKTNTTKNKYKRQVNSTTIDVYDVLVAFGVNNPATAHAVKKLLASGQRGYKDVIQDLKEAIQSIERAIEIESKC